MIYTKAAKAPTTPSAAPKNVASCASILAAGFPGTKGGTPPSPPSPCPSPDPDPDPEPEPPCPPPPPALLLGCTAEELFDGVAEVLLGTALLLVLLVGMGVVTVARVELEWLALALELKWLEYCW